MKLINISLQFIIKMEIQKKQAATSAISSKWSFYHYKNIEK
jgi:hypothetical protein